MQFELQRKVEQLNDALEIRAQHLQVFQTEAKVLLVEARQLFMHRKLLQLRTALKPKVIELNLLRRYMKLRYLRVEMRKRLKQTRYGSALLD